MSENAYARFYALLRHLPGADKETLVNQFTCGRTVHLHLMSRQEYDIMCNEMERVAGVDDRIAERRRALKRARSGVLHLMTLWGVNTQDYSAVDHFCEQTRIAGKPFRFLTHDDLSRLHAKLCAMLRKREQKNALKEMNR